MMPIIGKTRSCGELFVALQQILEQLTYFTLQAERAFHQAVPARQNFQCH
jgi:hypothetical protein